MPRIVLAGALFALVAVFVMSCGDPTSEHAGQRVFVIGVDGMDPVVLGRLIDAGRMPNFERLAAQGTFEPLETSAPPQSPVAWSNVICGADPGTHQIFDFIHRDPHPPGQIAVLPYLSTSTVDPPSRDWAIPLGSWRIPLFGGAVRLLRQGGAFWDELTRHGVDTAIYRMPANYPATDVDGAGRFQCLCGMGTPDLLGTYGEFTLFSSAQRRERRHVGGGTFVRLVVRDNRAETALTGPENFLRAPNDKGVPALQVPVEIVRDDRAAVAKITVGDEIVILGEGEWSDWVPISFDTGIPGDWALRAMQLPTSMPAMVRFHLKQVRPHLEVYVTPLNLDPMEPANPIGAPESFARELAEACGRYYTTGIPEDTKALRTGALTEDGFLGQVELLRHERIKQFRHGLAQFERGCFFFYFGHIDQLSHIFWRDTDPDHPGRKPEEAAKYRSVIEDAYIEMDGLLGEALAFANDDDSFIVMSDHGFTSFRRGFNLNNWLLDNGYLALHDPKRGRVPYLGGVDWSRTKAYGLGLNGLYLNQAGREKHGIIEPGDRLSLLDEIARDLLAVTDTDGTPVIDTVYVVERTYPGADPEIAPDILVGYADGYRASWSAAEGGFGTDLLEDNHDRWSGDHCIAHELVPGILVTNRSVAVETPSLIDLAPTILAEFGIEPPAWMQGRALFK